MNAITPKLRQVLEEYSKGHFPAEEAARRMGQDATVHDVIFQMRESGLPLPSQHPEAEREQFARALQMFGLVP